MTKDAENNKWLRCLSAPCTHVSIPSKAVATVTTPQIAHRPARLLPFLHPLRLTCLKVCPLQLSFTTLSTSPSLRSLPLYIHHDSSVSESAVATWHPLTLVSCEVLYFYFINNVSQLKQSVSKTTTCVDTSNPMTGTQICRSPVNM